jgi:tryptophan 2,3-dioxygenase
MSVGDPRHVRYEGRSDLEAERLSDRLQWRHHHALMASREIGIRQGTGGSLGVAYLQTTLDRRFVPDLWEVCNRL